MALLESLRPLAGLAASGALYLLAAALSLGAGLTRQEVVGRAAHWLLRGAFLAHAIGILLVSRGAGTAPWSELPGALVLFALGITGVQLLLGRHTQKIGRPTGLADAPVALLSALCLGMACLKWRFAGFGFALASPWLWLHVPAITLGLGSLAAVTFISVLILIRSEMRIAGLQFVGASLIGVYALLAAPELWAGRAVAGLATLTLVGSGGILLTRVPASRKGGTAKKAGGELPLRLLYLACVLAFAALSGLLWVAEQPDGPGLAESFRFWSGALVLLLAGSFAGFTLRREWLQERLPSDEILDHFGHRVVTVGFVLISIGILAGMAWAEVTWGRYWAWEAKEVGAVLVWIHYGAYLRTRQASHWKPRSGAALSLLGFGWLMMVLLGINLYWARGAHVFLGYK